MIARKWYQCTDALGSNVVTLGKLGCGFCSDSYMRITICGNDDRHEKQVAKLISKAPEMLETIKKMCGELHVRDKLEPSDLKRLLELEMLISECGG